MSLHQLVVDAAARHPDRLAVASPSDELRYAELDRWANAVAHRLRHLGVRRGDRVIIWTDKSVAAVAAMQGTLRVGAAYVPADGTTPPGRVAVMARDCGAAVVCAADGQLRSASAELGSHLRCLDIADGVDEPNNLDPLNESVSSDDLAYILYTSGSTGTPKGVCISHGNARAFVDWATAELTPGPADRFANHAPLTFDISVLDLYAAFAAGASVHLVSSELAYAPAQLVDFLHSREITIWYSVPSALALMMRDGGLLDRPAPAALRAVLFAGEPFPLPGVRMLATWTNARLLNLYGPTETNVCTAHEVTAADLESGRPLPIGRPACGNRVWARRADGSVAEPGEEGELVVEGPTVMLGYWGTGRQRGAYRTGDVVRVRQGGAFDYLGRRDHMVKVRGNRVELGEVETVLVTHPAVAEVAVVVSGTGVDARLVAFVVGRRGQRPGVLALKQLCAKRLPRHMVIDEVRVVDRLPLTRTGKVDRRALAATRSATLTGGIS